MHSQAVDGDGKERRSEGVKDGDGRCKLDGDKNGDNERKKQEERRRKEGLASKKIKIKKMRRPGQTAIVGVGWRSAKKSPCPHDRLGLLGVWTGLGIPQHQLLMLWTF